MLLIIQIPGMVVDRASVQLKFKNVDFLFGQS